MVSILQFIQKSGFKVLAMARLKECEYSLVLYLLNCAVSNLEQIITTVGELSTLIGYDEEDVRKALSALGEREIIKSKYPDTYRQDGSPLSLSLSLQMDISKWRLTYQEKANFHDAIVYPFTIRRDKPFELVSNKDKGTAKEANEEPWQKILEAFLEERELGSEEDAKAAEASAKMLIQTHPLEQTLLFLKHFRLRVPTLSLLASSWHHFEELFESETTQVDLLDARKKHLEQDEALRLRAKEWLNKKEELEFSVDEEGVLRVLLHHRHPRRQLFWAYQLRSRYPKLADFFTQNSSSMLPVTSTGMVVKKPNPYKT